MKVQNCRKCRRLFNAVGDERYCPACNKLIEEKFKQVKEYLREYPDAPYTEVIEECDVESKQLQEWIREERLIISESSPIGIPCEKCGKPIRAGKYCPDCRRALAQMLNSAITNKKERDERKGERDEEMRFLNRRIHS